MWCSELAAADVLTGLVLREELSAIRLLPDMFDGQVVPVVAAVEAERRRTDPAMRGVSGQRPAPSVSRQEGVAP